jgi:hypothetical protein
MKDPILLLLLYLLLIVGVAGYVRVTTPEPKIETRATPVSVDTVDLYVCDSTGRLMKWDTSEQSYIEVTTKKR